MSRRSELDPDGWHDERVDRIVAAQAECPYFERREPVEGLSDERWCLHDNKPCEARNGCPLGKW